MSRTWKIVIVAVVALIVAGGAAAIIWAATSDSKTERPFTHVDYAIAFAKAVIGTSTMKATLAQWPKNTQPFLSGNKPNATCYQWIDTAAIYSLCFDKKSGLLVDKALG